LAQGTAAINVVDVLKGFRPDAFAQLLCFRVELEQFTAGPRFWWFSFRDHRIQSCLCEIRHEILLQGLEGASQRADSKDDRIKLFKVPEFGEVKTYRRRREKTAVLTALDQPLKSAR